MATNETAKSGEPRPITYKELIKVREEEMNRNILPGFMTTVKDPGTSGRMTNVYSKTRYETMSVTDKE